MATTPTPSDPAATAPPMTQEADIGSGEKSPGQADTEQAIKSIPRLPEDDSQPANPKGA